MRVQPFEQLERTYHLTGTIQIAQPLLQHRALVGIARKAIVNELHLLLGRVLKRKHAGAGVDQTLDRIVVAKLHLQVAQDAQLGRRLRERQDRDGIAIDVTQPSYRCCRLDLDSSPHDVDVMPLARPHHRAVWAE